MRDGLGVLVATVVIIVVALMAVASGATARDRSCPAGQVVGGDGFCIHAYATPTPISSAR